MAIDFFSETIPLPPYAAEEAESIAERIYQYESIFQQKAGGKHPARQATV